MADDLLEGVLGAEEEPSEAARPEGPAGAEAFASAIAAIASRQDPGVARKTEVFLDKQARLLDLQARHLEDEHSSRLTHLRLTVAAAKRKCYADRMRNTLYTCIALIVAGVLVAGVRMTVQALNDHSLVVEDFTVPADLVARGVSSQSLAEDLASRVAAIRDTAAHYSLTQSSEVRADQTNILKVQIPDTGVSIDELERFMHRWLGHQTVVNGELRDETDGKISIMLHIAGADPIVVKGSVADLDQLMQTTAERAFAIFDPINDVIYLIATGHPAAAYDASVRYAHNPRAAQFSTRDRAIAYSLMTDFDPDRRRALSSALIATDIDPRLLIGWKSAASASADLGHDQAALGFYDKALGTKSADQPPQERGAYPRLIAEAKVYIDQTMGDFAALPGDYQTVDLSPRMQVGDDYAQRAQAAALLHDEALSREDLTHALAAGPADGTVVEAQWDVSVAAADWAQALAVARTRVAAAEAQEAAAQAPDSRTELQLQTLYRPRFAYAEAMTGDTAAATALISQTPTDCYLCVSTRALVAAAAGDTAGADRWFAQAVRQGPDLPMAYLEWGQTLLARGDLAGAVRDFALAHDKGPHFADPLKGWGDALVKQGQPKEALAKYDAALRDAPNWVALKQARDAAAAMTEHRT